MDIYAECGSNPGGARSQEAAAEPVAQKPGAGAPAASDSLYENYLPPMPEPTSAPVLAPVLVGELVHEAQHLAPAPYGAQHPKARKTKLVLGLAAVVALAGVAVTFLSEEGQSSSSSPTSNPQAPTAVPPTEPGAITPTDDPFRDATSAHLKAAVPSPTPKPSTSPTAPAVKHAEVPVFPRRTASPEPQPLSPPVALHPSTPTPKPTHTPTCVLLWWCNGQSTH
ncbi:MAG: hypothetical protein JO362_04945 [Streptomycetaceae bacterium]|nr:hypothetical protein [Streptomycetaceae bacterium]